MFIFRKVDTKGQLGDKYPLFFYALPNTQSPRAPGKETIELYYFDVPS